MRPKYDKDKGCRLIIPRVVVKTGYRHCDDAVQWRGNAVPRCSESPPTSPALQNKKNNNISKNFGRTPLYGEVSKT
jgi:hypothetical protein